MKKFTKISNTSVGEEKVEKVVNENTLKYEILSLMDNFLEIKTYGNVSPVYMVPTKIEGKELFVEALMDFLQEKIEDKSIKVLESLKHEIKDWKSIDEKIESILEEREKNILKNNIINTIDKYSDNRFYVYMALDCAKAETPRQMDEDEFIVVENGFSKTELMHVIYNGQMNVASSFAILLGLNKLKELGLS
jgi:hypothetical protein